MADPAQIIGLDWVSLLLTLLGSVYYLKGRIDTLEKQLNKRIDDLVNLYDKRIDDLQEQLRQTTYMLNKRLNSVENKIK